MIRSKVSRPLLAGCGLALALGVSGCAGADGNGSSRSGDPANEAPADATRAGASGHEGAVVTLTGCLQKQGSGDHFVLTQVNEPSSAIGTGGGSPDVVAKEQMRAAKHAYELEAGNDDELSKMVGKQVRITGKLEEISNLNQQRAGNKPDADGRREIEAGDLAKVSVQTVAQVADSCSDAR